MKQKLWKITIFSTRGGRICYDTIGIVRATTEKNAKNKASKIFNNEEILYRCIYDATQITQKEIDILKNNYLSEIKEIKEKLEKETKIY